MTNTNAINRLIGTAIRDVQAGTREIPLGSNRGPRVEKMLATTGLPGGYPWCAAAVATWGVEAFGSMWPVPRSADCDVLLDFARRKKILHKSPEPGDIFLVLKSESDAIHTGIVTSYNNNPNNPRMGTIEGNTNNEGGREGYMVAKRTRLVNSQVCFIRWVDLLDLDMANATTVDFLGQSVPARLEDGVMFAELRALQAAYPAMGHVDWNINHPTLKGERLLCLWKLTGDGKTIVGVRSFAALLGLSVEYMGGKARVVKPQ